MPCLCSVAMSDTYLQSTSQCHFLCCAVQEAGRYKSYRISLQGPNDPPGHVFFLAEHLREKTSRLYVVFTSSWFTVKQRKIFTTDLQMNTQTMQIAEHNTKCKLVSFHARKVHSGCKGRAPLILNFGTWRQSVVNLTPYQVYPWESTPVPTE